MRYRATYRCCDLSRSRLCLDFVTLPRTRPHFRFGTLTTRRVGHRTYDVGPTLDYMAKNATHCIPRQLFLGNDVDKQVSKGFRLAKEW